MPNVDPVLEILFQEVKEAYDIMILCGYGFVLRALRYGGVMVECQEYKQINQYIAKIKTLCVKAALSVHE